MAYTLTVQRIEEQPGVGRLGRNLEHDQRSRSFQVAQVPVVSKVWPRRIPVLDQGDTGSCTGQAAAGALGSDPFFGTLPASLLLDEAEAVALYSEATVLDSFAGDFPPDDTGSTGLAVAKACKQDGLISGYQHALGLSAALSALMSGPVITGVNWYSSFDDPDLNGDVEISPNADVRGGHEFVVRGVDLDAQRVHADNSWGPRYGDNGSFNFSFDDWDRLLSEDGDVTLFVPLTEPAPVPTPVPTDDVDADLAPILRKIVKHRYHRFKNSELDVVRAWLTAKD